MAYQWLHDGADHHAGYFDGRLREEDAPKDIYQYYSECFDQRHELGITLPNHVEGLTDLEKRLSFAVCDTGYTTVYRVTSREYFRAGSDFPGNFEDSDRKRAAAQRYSPIGTVGHYVGLTLDGALDEASYYGEGRIDPSKYFLLAMECCFDNILHLGSASVLGEILEDLGESVHDGLDDCLMRILDPKTNNDLTDRIGLWARKRGISGLIYPTARFDQRQAVEKSTKLNGKTYPVINHVALGSRMDMALGMDDILMSQLVLGQKLGVSLKDWTPIYAELNIVLFSGEQLSGRDRAVFYQTVPLEQAELLLREDQRATTINQSLYHSGDGLSPKPRQPKK